MVFLSFLISRDSRNQVVKIRVPQTKTSWFKICSPFFEMFEFGKGTDLSKQLSIYKMKTIMISSSRVHSED